MNTQVQPLPWQPQTMIDGIVHGFTNAHAILLTGPQGIGKNRLATTVAHAVLGNEQSAHAANLFNAGSHPDLHVLTSAASYHQAEPCLQQHAMRYLAADALEKKRLSQQIGIDTVRALIHNLEESSTLAGNKLVVLFPAENLNRSSANAMLKFLEEPTRETLLLLISHDISRIPATVRSRCMKITVPVPHGAAAQGWLQSEHETRSATDIVSALALSGYRPLLASQYLHNEQQALVAELLSDVVQICTGNPNHVSIARKWLKFKQTEFILAWLCKLFSDVIKYRLNAGAASGLFNTTTMLDTVGKPFKTDRLFQIYDYFNSLSQRFDGVIDESLLIEDVILTLTDTSWSTAAS